MKRRLRFTLVLLVLLAGSSATVGAQTLEELTATEQLTLGNRLGSQECDCGCGLTVAQCLIDDPSCGTSQALAKEAIATLIAERTASAAPRSSPTPAPRHSLPPSDGGEWFLRVNGKLLVYISTSSGGYREKDCTWLYEDGTFFNNNQTGSVTSLGTSAGQSRDRGSWSVRGNVLTLAPPGGERQSFSMSVDADGTFHLDDWRYFIVEHDHETCR